MKIKATTYPEMSFGSENEWSQYIKDQLRTSQNRNNMSTNRAFYCGCRAAEQGQVKDPVQDPTFYEAIRDFCIKEVKVLLDKWIEGYEHAST